MSHDSEYLKAAARLCNATAVRQAARHLSKAYNRALSDVGLSGTQYQVLLLLSRRGPSSIPDIADTLVMDRSNIGHSLRPLERDGFITISTGESDRRRKVIALTDEGQARLKKGAEAWSAAQLRFETLFGVDEARGMRETMARVTDLPLD